MKLQAPSTKYRVVGIDTFDGTDFIIGDYDTFQEATEIAKAKGGTMMKTHVYDSCGLHMFDAGEF